jgi:hypothetical protein
LEAVELLVTAGADVNEPVALSGLAPLHLVALHSSRLESDVMSLLLRLGANPDAYCDWGLTPLGLLLHLVQKQADVELQLLRSVTHVPPTRTASLPVGSISFELDQPVKDRLLCGNSDKVCVFWFRIAWCLTSLHGCRSCVPTQRLRGLTMQALRIYARCRRLAR